MAPVASPGDAPLAPATPSPAPGRDASVATAPPAFNAWVGGEVVNTARAPLPPPPLVLAAQAAAAYNSAWFIHYHAARDHFLACAAGAAMMAAACLPHPPFAQRSYWPSAIGDSLAPCGPVPSQPPTAAAPPFAAAAAAAAAALPFAAAATTITPTPVSVVDAVGQGIPSFCRS